MSAPVVQTRSKTGKAYQKSLELKEGFEMKTAIGIEKSKVWISQNLGTKMATRLFRGLALGVLLVAGTGIYFSINQGEVGSSASVDPNEVWAEIDSGTPIHHLVKYHLPTQGKVGRFLSREQLELSQDYEMVGMPWRVDDQGRVVVVEAPQPSFSPCPVAQTEVWSEIEETPICHLMKVR
jgi:hypothetical protein